LYFSFERRLYSNMLKKTGNVIGHCFFSIYFAIGLKMIEKKKMTPIKGIN
jgi:Na+/H+-dicarboxylate symporter